MSNQSPFKWRHFEARIIVLCVRWYLRYSLSYRDLEEMMRDHLLTTVDLFPQRGALPRRDGCAVDQPSRSYAVGWRGW